MKRRTVTDSTHSEAASIAIAALDALARQRVPPLGTERLPDAATPSLDFVGAVDTAWTNISKLRECAINTLGAIHRQELASASIRFSGAASPLALALAAGARTDVEGSSQPSHSSTENLKYASLQEMTFTTLTRLAALAGRSKYPEDVRIGKLAKACLARAEVSHATSSKRAP